MLLNPPVLGKYFCLNVDIANMIKPFCSHCKLIWIGTSTSVFFLFIYLWKRKQTDHCGIPVSLQCLLKSRLSALPDVYLFPELVFQGVLKEKQQTMCRVEQMVSWFNFKKCKHKPTPCPYTWWFTLRKKHNKPLWSYMRWQKLCYKTQSFCCSASTV